MLLLFQQSCLHPLLCIIFCNFGLCSSQSYKRVGGQKHNAVTGRGIIGVADITDLIVWFVIIVLCCSLFLLSYPCVPVIETPDLFTG
jgi:hypothetical protein